MIRSSHTTFASLTRLASIVVSYVLLVALISPLTRSGVIAAHVSSKVKVSTISTAPVVALRSSQAGRPAGAHRVGEVLVRFRPGVTEGEKNALAAARGARRGRPLRGASRFERLEILGGQTPQLLAEQLADQAAVEWVEPNYLIGRDDLTPNDERFKEQWALHNTGNALRQLAGADIAAPSAWERTT